MIDKLIETAGKEPDFKINKFYSCHRRKAVGSDDSDLSFVYVDRQNTGKFGTFFCFSLDFVSN